MAHVEIVPEGEDTADAKAIVRDLNAPAATAGEDIEPYWFATCTCGVSGTDRGNFEDTIQWALVHVEGAHE